MRSARPMSSVVSGAVRVIIASSCRSALDRSARRSKRRCAARGPRVPYTSQAFSCPFVRGEKAKVRGSVA
jgi:hypothetical protein